MSIGISICEVAPAALALQRVESMREGYPFCAWPTSLCYLLDGAATSNILEVLPVPVRIYFRNHICMIRAVIIGAIAATVVVVFTAPAFGALAEGIPELEQGFLQKAAERHQAEVALGQLALQKASSDRVKQYGARMIQDHQKVIEDVQKLIKKEGELSMPHQQIQRKLSQLSGKDFDKAFMSFMVQDHEKDLGELKQRAPTLTDPRVEHWTADALRIVKDHLEEAQAIATEIGANPTHESLAQDSSSQ